jgi:hypothetical protein
VYATLLLMSSTLGGDVTPPSAGIIQVSHRGGGCTGAPVAPACCDSGGHARASLLDRIHARHAPKSSECCPPAPAAPPVSVAPPAPAASCCDACGSGGHRGWLDKIKARCHPHSRRSNDCCSASDPCATTGGAAVGGGTTPPKEMPKPKEKDEESSSVSPAPAPAPTVPVAPTSGGGTPF